MAETTTKNLREKIIAVMADVFGVGKHGKTQVGQQYSYQRAADIFPKVQKALIEHGVAFIAHEISVIYPPSHESKNGGTVFVCSVEMQYRFHDTTSDEVLSGNSSGLAFDSSDKALNKAKTAALKYFFKQTLLLAEEDDDSEVDTFDEVRSANQPTNRPQSRQEPPKPPSPPPNDDAFCTESQRKALWAQCRARASQVKKDDMAAQAWLEREALALGVPLKEGYTDVPDPAQMRVRQYRALLAMVVEAQM